MTAIVQPLQVESHHMTQELIYAPDVPRVQSGCRIAIAWRPKGGLPQRHFFVTQRLEKALLPGLAPIPSGLLRR